MTRSTLPSETRASARDDELAIALRPLATIAEYRACVALQLETWGRESPDIVPASLVSVAHRCGGLAVGAFGADDALIGFVFGLTAIVDGKRSHWSHMLAVRAASRGAGVGRRLKEYQISALSQRGVEELYWTFDPLQARNAYLNLNRLGANVVDYVPNMYGTSASPLHHGMETDRLIVSCPTTGRRPRSATFETDLAASLPVLTLVARPGDVTVDISGPPLHAQALIEIPADLEAVAHDSHAQALAWRAATRAHLQWALKHAFTIVALVTDDASDRAFYLISRDPSPFPQA